MTKTEIKASILANIVGQGNQVDISGKIGGVLNSIIDLIPDPTATFIPKTDFVTEEIELSAANTKYGLTDEIFGKMTKGEIGWVSLGDAATDKAVKIIVREEDKYILCGGADGDTDYHLTITMTDDGKFDITVPAV